jgi:lactoylglutathione lyase
VTTWTPAARGSNPPTVTRDKCGLEGVKLLICVGGGDQQLGYPGQHAGPLVELGDPPGLPGRAAGPQDRVFFTLSRMGRRAFPVVYSSDVPKAAAFYERLGFEVRYQLPAEGPPGYVSLARDGVELAIVDRAWPSAELNIQPGAGPRFEVFIDVEDVEEVLSSMRGAGAALLKRATDMPWGERVGYLADPDGNPVGLATPSSQG